MKLLKFKTQAKYLAAIEEMERQLKIGFERIETRQKHIREVQARVDATLDEMEMRR